MFIIVRHSGRNAGYPFIASCGKQRRIDKTASTYKEEVNLTNSGNNKITIAFLPVSSEETLHIILEVSDNGNPKLTRYKRLVLKLTP